MSKVRAKKHLGQHFLTDKNIAERIVEALFGISSQHTILEIGPGMGVLSDFLLQEENRRLVLIDIDEESTNYLNQKYQEKQVEVLNADFLNMDLQRISGPDKFAIIGNFPYNISSQIFFKILENKEKVTEVVCMLQKEVADRLVSGPGNKTYGILSVLLQAYYEMEYLFTVGPEVFDPPPKVNSAVISLKRNSVEQLDCDEKLFRRMVKEGFQKRRKTLRNALKGLNLPANVAELDIMNKRAEQLSVQDFVDLSNTISE